LNGIAQFAARWPILDCGQRHRPLSHAKIGRNCLIGAKTLIPEGRTIPDNSLVIGVRGKVVRSLAADEIQGLTKSAIGYAANWKRYVQSFRHLGQKAEPA
jgi:carbonic anhydrase/acetyltransferase-like protein (isoleucine patch superfamily)